MTTVMDLPKLTQFVPRTHSKSPRQTCEDVAVKRRFVYAYDNLLPSTGADADQVISTIAGLSRNGVEQSLCVATAPGQPPLTTEALCDHYLVDGQFAVTPIPIPSRSRLIQKWAFAHRCLKALDKQSLDVLHTRHLPVAFLALRRGYKVLYETYRPWAEQYASLSKPIQWMMRHPNLIGVMTHSIYAAQSFQSLTCRPERVTVMHNGYDASRMGPAKSTSAAREEIGIDPDGFVVTYTGRVNAKKGLGTVLDVAPLCPEITFLVVGSEGEGSIEQAGASIPNVHFHPWQSYERTPTYLYASDLLLIPPSNQALNNKMTVLPIKLFPYLATGRPIVAPRAVDTEELLTHEQNALLVEPDNLASFRDGLNRLKDDAHLREHITQGALKTAESLTWDARAERIITFVNDMSDD
jgi:starch synthase